MQVVTQFRWDYVKCPDSGHRRWRRYSASRAIISPGGWGDKPDGSLWTACPATVSHTFFPLYVPSWTPWRPGGHSLSPAALGWPALLDCRMRMTAFLPSHRTAVAGRSECPTTEAWHHRPNRHYPIFRGHTQNSVGMQSINLRVNSIFDIFAV